MEDTNPNQIQKTLREKLGTPITQRTDVENEILGRLRYFHEWYKKRDESKAEEFVKELMVQQIQIIGTNGVYQGDDEWFSGYEAAIKLVQSDWKYWGDLTLYLQHAQIDVEENSGWATVFGTMTLDPDKAEYMKFEASKSRVLKKIKETAETQNKDSTLALHKIIKESITILHQYQQENVFVWPLRISFGFVKRSNKWWMKQMHFSYPSKGFPSVRL